jgi:hypothetical protein
VYVHVFVRQPHATDERERVSARANCFVDHALTFAHLSNAQCTRAA